MENLQFCGFFTTCLFPLSSSVHRPPPTACLLLCPGQKQLSHCGQTILPTIHYPELSRLSNEDESGALGLVTPQERCC